jgi:glycosyltransferase involved in cell wall biosynthesis
MVYIEPTPYISGLVDALRRIWAGPIEAYYISTDLTQPWRLELAGAQDAVLPAGFFSLLRALWSVLRRDRKHTIVHLAGWGHAALFGAMMIAAVLGIPVAVESDTPDGRPVGNFRRLLKILFYPCLFRVPRRFFPGGTRQAQYLARFGVDPARMTVAQMTVDVDAIRRFGAEERASVRSAARVRWGMSADERVVLYVGRLEDYKGVQVLLAAFARTASEENGLCLAIAGDGTLRSRIEAIAAAPDRRVSYLGRLSGDDVLRAYIAADIFVLPSLSESWGLAVNEAMACGLPVIVSDQVGCANDLVQRGETGLVVGAQCENELASAIRQLAGDEPARRRMGQAAERLISSWTLENEASNIVCGWRGMAR